MVHGRVVRFQCLPDPAPDAVTPHQELILHLRALPHPRGIFEPGPFLIQVQVGKGAAVVQLDPTNQQQTCEVLWPVWSQTFSER